MQECQASSWCGLPAVTAAAAHALGTAYCGAAAALIAVAAAVAAAAAAAAA